MCATGRPRERGGVREGKKEGDLRRPKGISAAPGSMENATFPELYRVIQVPTRASRAKGVAREAKEGGLANHGDAGMEPDRCACVADDLRCRGRKSEIGRVSGMRGTLLGSVLAFW